MSVGVIEAVVCLSCCIAADSRHRTVSSRQSAATTENVKPWCNH